jgi:tetracycline resistance efflux pump
MTLSLYTTLNQRRHTYGALLIILDVGHHCYDATHVYHYLFMNELANYADSVASILPPVLAILLAVATRKIITSLMFGIVVGALMLNDFTFSSSISYIFNQFLTQFWIDGHLNDTKVYLFGFLVLLGVMTALITTSGGARAFAEWVRRRIRNKKDAQLSTIMLGMTVFIDDYFNSLVVGSIARPITDRYYISRAKLAYLLDSSAAPVCVLAPISSWGAYIIALIGTVMLEHGLVEQSYLSLFVQMIPMNFYAIFALAFMICVVIYNLDFGPMKHQEINAQKGQLFDESKGLPPGMSDQLEMNQEGKMRGLFLPILILSVVTLFTMGLTGYLQAQASEVTVMAIMEHADVTFSLLIGGFFGCAVSLILAVNQGMTRFKITHFCRIGANSMMPAIHILLVASVMSNVIGALNTGEFMSNMALNYMPDFALPAMLFFLSALTAFSTGTSFATFAIMLPIAADMALGSNSSMLLPFMAAVLAGGVCGDHCSPISDTTILSATGASCHHMDHMITQLPYALIVAGISLVGYLVLGWTGSVWLGFAGCIAAMVVAVTFLKWRIHGTVFQKQLKPL